MVSLCISSRALRSSLRYWQFGSEQYGEPNSSGGSSEAFAEEWIDWPCCHAALDMVFLLLRWFEPRSVLSGGPPRVMSGGNITEGWILIGASPKRRASGYRSGGCADACPGPLVF